MAVGTTLAILCVAAPVGAVDPGPGDAVRAVFDALDRGRFGDIPRLFCSAHREDAARRLDLTDVMRDVPGVSRGSFIRLLDVTVSRFSTTILEDDSARALVEATATIEVTLDETGLRRALAGLPMPIGVLDGPQLRSITAQRIRERLASVPSPLSLDEEIEVVWEAGAWKVCGDIGWGIEALDPADVCSLFSPAELAILVAIPFSQRTATGSGCTYSAADGTGELSTVNVRLEEGDLELFRSAFPAGASFTIMGLDAYAADGSVWVDLGGTHLTIQPALYLPPDGTDPQRLAEAIAEIVVPRIDH